MTSKIHYSSGGKERECIYGTAEHIHSAECIAIDMNGYRCMICGQDGIWPDGSVQNCDPNTLIEEEIAEIEALEEKYKNCPIPLPVMVFGGFALYFLVCFSIIFAPS